MQNITLIPLFISCDLFTTSNMITYIAHCLFVGFRVPLRRGIQLFFVVLNRGFSLLIDAPGDSA